jgi:hypothetical protein
MTVLMAELFPNDSNCDTAQMTVIVTKLFLNDSNRDKAIFPNDSSRAKARSK